MQRNGSAISSLRDILRRGTWTSEAYRTFPQMISGVMRNPISSPGIGGWSFALRLAGWPDDRPVWTGTCPCQPFTAAGAGKAADDERHLWPAWFSLIGECRPAIVFGEQVEAAIGWGWLDAVFADLEAEGYACGAAVLPACSVGAPHIRQRFWFVADAASRRGGTSAAQPEQTTEASTEANPRPEPCSAIRGRI